MVHREGARDHAQQEVRALGSFGGNFVSRERVLLMRARGSAVCIPGHFGNACALVQMRVRPLLVKVSKVSLV